MLYQKYRSNDLNEIYGQDNIVAILKRQLIEKTYGHAYLFVGIRGVGKTSIARIFSKAINCTDTVDHEPCNKCDACRSFNSGRMIDIIEIDAASNNGVDHMRDLTNLIKSVPYGKKKIVIIDEVHMLSKSAFNALLKSLEEPPEHVIFILATTELNQVLPTIRSRCQMFTFKRIEVEVMVTRMVEVLQKEGYEKAALPALEKIARLADGSMRDALSLLESLLLDKSRGLTVEYVDDCLGLVSSDVLVELVNAILNKELKSALSILRDTYSSGADAMTIVDGLKDFIVSMVYHLSGIERISANFDVVSKIDAIGKDFSIESLTNLYAYVEDMKNNRNFVFADLELLILKTSTRLFDLDEQVKSDLCDLYKKVEKLEKDGVAIKEVNSNSNDEVQTMPNENVAEIKNEISENEDEMVFGFEFDFTENISENEISNLYRFASSDENNRLVTSSEENKKQVIITSESDAQVINSYMSDGEDVVLFTVENGNDVTEDQRDFEDLEPEFDYEEAIFNFNQFDGEYDLYNNSDESEMEINCKSQTFINEDETNVKTNLYEIYEMFTKHNVLGLNFEDNVEIVVGEDNIIDIFVKYPTTYHTYLRYYKMKQGPFKEIDNKVNLIMVNQIQKGFAN